MDFLFSEIISRESFFDSKVLYVVFEVVFGFYMVGWMIDYFGFGIEIVFLNRGVL